MNNELAIRLRKLGKLLADFAHGIDAGNAIRHGLEPSPRSRPTISDTCREGR